jgi:hypothetical protein
MFHPAKLDRLTMDFKITQAGSITGDCWRLMVGMVWLL